jgi:Ca2+-binding RTX toxin-like protein
MTTRRRALPLTVLSLALVAPASAAVIDGTSGPDRLVGTAQADAIRGYGGLDRIYGKAGADRLLAGRDNKRDKVRGGPGNDRIYVSLGDTTYAGRGNDVIRIHTAAQGWTRVYCGPGYDRLDETFGEGHGGAAEPDDGNDWLVEWHSCEEVR